MKSLSRYFTTLFIAIFIASIAPAECEAQGFLKTLKEKVSGTKNEDSKTKGKKSKKDDNVDIMDLSLDENLMRPIVPVKEHDKVAAYMKRLARNLASRKRERIEMLRDGEVIVATIGTDALFAPNDSVLRQSAGELLEPYKHLLKSMGMYKILVVAHTDDTGSEKYTNHLSELRVEAVYKWLRHGVAGNVEIVPYALGSSDPLLPNNSTANRRSNRRIEIFIVPNRLMLEMAKSNKLQ